LVRPKKVSPHGTGIWVKVNDKKFVNQAIRCKNASDAREDHEKTETKNSRRGVDPSLKGG